MSVAISGVGTQFKRGNGASSEVFTAVAEVVSIGGPSLSAEFIDVTNLDSTGGYREYIRGFRDGGQVTLNMNWNQASFSLFLGDYQTAGSVNYQIVFADAGATTVDFAGFVTDMPMSIPTDDKVSLDVTIKVTGQVTVTT